MDWPEAQPYCPECGLLINEDCRCAFETQVEEDAPVATVEDMAEMADDRRAA